MRKIFLFLLFCNSSLWAQKKELIGELSVSDILIQPKFFAQESGEQKFELERSYFFFSWKIHRDLSVHFGLGQFGLMNINERLSSNLLVSGDYSELSFFEAYANYDLGYGTVKAGIIPLFLGWEAVRRESEWYFPRTLFYENHDFGLRDIGASYSVDSHGFFTDFALHNGENGEDVDGRMWHSARLGWRSDRGVEFAVSASNGKYERTKLDPKEEYHYFNSYLNFEFRDLMILAEGFYAKSESKSVQTSDLKFWDYHLDVSHPLTRFMNGLARYEVYDPDNTVYGDEKRRWIAGVSFFNELHTSQLYIWGILNKEEGSRVHNNEIQVVWKVRSLTFF